MKADVWQQHSIRELIEIDAELGRLAHRVKHLAEQQRFEAVQSDHRDANDKLAAIGLALDDLEAQVTRFESEIDGVRQREDRDRSLMGSGTTNAKQQTELQHELETLERRQSSLEDSLLEVMERREQLQEQQIAALEQIDALESDVAEAQKARDDALVEIDESRHSRSARRDELSGTLDSELVALYERQRAANGVGAGLLQGRRCGACRIEIDRGEIARITAADQDEVVRCPECGAILLRIPGGSQ